MGRDMQVSDSVSIAAGAQTVNDQAATGGRLFSDFQRRNIRRTPAAMKADFEGHLDEAR